MISYLGMYICWLDIRMSDGHDTICSIVAALRASVLEPTLSGLSYRMLDLGFAKHVAMSGVLTYIEYENGGCYASQTLLHFV